MSGVKEAARAIRRTSRDVVERVPQTTMGVIRKAPPKGKYSPIQVEVTNSSLVLDEDDLSLGQGVRRYHIDKGLQVGDALSLDPLGNGDWLAQEVFSSAKPPSNDDGAGAAPYYIPAGETFVVPLYKQVLWAIPIEIDGTLEIDGMLIGVD